MAAGMA
ncbi:hypothetical protein YPPY12_2017, partial [Yersinia pestis PY-12]